MARKSKDEDTQGQSNDDSNERVGDEQKAETAPHTTLVKVRIDDDLKQKLVAVAHKGGMSLAGGVAVLGDMLHEQLHADPDATVKMFQDGIVAAVSRRMAS